jgi:putative N-acetylmannosamine-6-phosphate epimerase
MIERTSARGLVAVYALLGAQAKVSELYQVGVVREFYFHQKAHTAVLMLDCASVDEARECMTVCLWSRQD